MPIYRYQGPQDSSPHVVTAERYERDETGDGAVAFVNPTSFDGEKYPASVATLVVVADGEIELVEL
jgi:hypothetical protein